MKRRGILTILKSCLTGKAIWIYRGPTKHSAGKAYRRACYFEKKWSRRFLRAITKRKNNIQGFLGNLVASHPFTERLPQPTRRAARKIGNVSKKESRHQSEFYQHIKEERKRVCAKQNRK